MTENLNIPPMRCLVVDDEPMASKGIVGFINKLDFLQVDGVCSSAFDASKYLQEKPIDLLFLDINMPYLSGLDFLESLKNPPLTILTTAYSEYALEGFRLQVVDYLLKPIAFKRFYQAVTKAQQLFRQKESPQSNTAQTQPYLYIRQKEDTFQKIAWEDILYLESMQNYVKLHFKDDTSVIHQTMTVLEQTLPQNIFFRIHKSFLVNVNHIDSISGGRLFVNKQELPIARDRKGRLLETVVFKNLISK